MSVLPPHIRNACHEDAPEIAELQQQLGYDSKPEEVAGRIASVQRSSTDVVFVATSEEHVVGCISLHVMPLFHATGFLGRVTSLVVDVGCRGQGIGKALMASADEWFASNGCVKIEVTSDDQRESAHQFYESLGFSRDGRASSRRCPWLPEMCGPETGRNWGALSGP